MRRTANGRRVYALADYTVERTGKGWYFGRTSRFGDMHAMKGPYSSERSVALMIARELLNEIAKRDAQTTLPRMTGEFFCAHRAGEGGQSAAVRPSCRDGQCQRPDDSGRMLERGLDTRQLCSLSS